MEEVNPWLDPDVGKHKNKKSVRPMTDLKQISSVTIIQKEAIITKEKEKEKLVPGTIKVNDPRILDFFTTLVNDSLNTDLPLSVSQWAIENFDEQWLQEFLQDVKNLQEDLLTSKFFPSSDKMLLLKLIFLLRQ